MVCTNTLSREIEPRLSECQMLGDNHDEWIYGRWINTTLDYSGVEMQMKPLSLLTHLYLFAV